MSEVLIAGCGYVGSRLAQRLLEKGVTVHGLRRTTAKLPSGVNPIKADLTALDSIPQLPSGITHVVYCAAANAHDADAYRAMYVIGLQNLLRVLRESSCDIQRFLYVSSTGVYGQSEGEWVSEESCTEPTRFSGQILLEGEERALRANVPTVVVRFSGIYGPGRTHLLRQVAEGAAVIYQGVPQVTNSIHREDCAGILEFLLQYEGELESLYVASDEEPAQRADVLRFIASCIDAPMPKTLSAQEAPSKRHGGNKRIDSSKIRALGYRFHYPSYRQGYPPLCAEFIERKKQESNPTS